MCSCVRATVSNTFVNVLESSFSVEISFIENGKEYNMKNEMKQEKRRKKECKEQQNYYKYKYGYINRLENNFILYLQFNHDFH